MAGGASYMFVSLARQQGDFGVANWDDECEADASAAGLAAGDYLAWLSTSTINAADTLPSGPFFRPDGVLIALSKADLIDGKILNPISLKADGSPPQDTLVWTGTLANGTASPIGSCDDWSSADNGTRGGNGRTSFTDQRWSESIGEGIVCNGFIAVFCIQTN